MPLDWKSLPQELKLHVVTFLDAKNGFQFLVLQQQRTLMKKALMAGYHAFLNSSNPNADFVQSLYDDSCAVDVMTSVQEVSELFLILYHLQLASLLLRGSSSIQQWPISIQSIYFGQGRYAKLLFCTCYWSPILFGFRCNTTTTDTTTTQQCMLGKAYVVDGEQSFKTTQVFGYHLSYTDGALRARLVTPQSLETTQSSGTSSLPSWVTQDDRLLRERSFLVQWTTDDFKMRDYNHVLLKLEVSHRTRLFCEFQRKCAAPEWNQSGIIFPR